MKHPIGYTSNGVQVYVDLIHSEAAGHIAQQPHLLGLVNEVLRKTTLRELEVSIEHDMGRTIGYDFVVGTTDKDSVFYAQPLREKIYTRFVKNSKPIPAQHLALVLQRDDEGFYELLNAWIGHISPPRPGSINETTESKPYWETHAFVLDNQPIQTRTLTKVCPY
jgi:hypothetical protein